ncbi:MAG: hypothetical protein QOD46_289 [Actinomycetota bacterium]|nr:hypothetical protein [Actinomycetota bacterium]
MSASRLFDLNIEEVLENWEVSHGLREIISNALDEQTLTDTGDVEITKDERGRWVIRDHGRGLRIEHFTLNENQEKLERASGVIGKFGVGLKDALATFHRRGVDVTIRSRHGTFRLRETAKHGFAAITTLHVEFDPAPNDMKGTEVTFEGVSDADMAAAKSLFLRFNDERLLEETKYGQILERGDEGRVYISGVFASEEPGFLFSYNVTDLTDAMRKRLNRERLNVGRTTYADRIRSILRAASSAAVMEEIIANIRTRSQGQVPDELTWIEITVMALTYLHQERQVVFVTEPEVQRNPDLVDHARSDGIEVIVVTTLEKAKLVEQERAGGVATRTLETYVKEFNDSFEYTFVDEAHLSPEEQAVLNLADELCRLVGVRKPPVLISETMRISRDDTEGVWDRDLGAIVIRRDKLRSRTDFAATLLHEVAHATSGTVDVTREFEAVLTRYLGRTSLSAVAAKETSH